VGNLYTSQAYLDVVIRTYYAGRSCEPAHFRLEDRVFRLLAKRGLWGTLGPRPLPTTPFLDMHEPVPDGQVAGPSHRLTWLARVSHGMVPADEFQARALADDFMAAPTVLWQGFPAWNDYLAFLRGRSSLVKDDQRRMRRLDETLGRVEFAVDDDREDVLSTCFRWKSQQMVETLGLDAFADERNRRFFRELRAAGLLNASTLRAGDRLLAAWLGAIHDGRWYGWIFTYDRDPALRRLSLGRLLLYRMLEESHRRGHREFDFSIGDEPYKWFFATHARMIAPLGTPPLHLRVRRVGVTTLKALPWLERRVRSLRDWSRSRKELPTLPASEAAAGVLEE
jgi:hypothetical protein